MECKRFEEKLNSLVDDGLSADELREIEGHLASCPHCARSLAELKKAKGYIERLEDIEPPAWFEQKIMRGVRLEHEKKSVWHKLFQPLYIKLPVQALAMAVVVIIAVQVFRMVEPEIKTTMPAAPVPAPAGEAREKTDSATGPAAVAERTKGRRARVPSVPSEQKPVQPEAGQELKKDSPATAMTAPTSRPARSLFKENKMERAVAPSPPADYAGAHDSSEAERQEAYGSRLAEPRAAAAKGKKEQEDTPLSTKSSDYTSRKKAKAPAPGPAGLAPSVPPVALSISPHAPDTAGEDIKALLREFNAGGIRTSTPGIITAEVPADRLEEFFGRLAGLGNIRTIPAPRPATGAVRISITIDPRGR